MKKRTIGYIAAATAAGAFALDKLPDGKCDDIPGTQAIENVYTKLVTPNTVQQSTSSNVLRATAYSKEQFDTELNKTHTVEQTKPLGLTLTNDPQSPGDFKCSFHEYGNSASKDGTIDQPLTVKDESGNDMQVDIDNSITKIDIDPNTGTVTITLRGTASDTFDVSGTSVPVTKIFTLTDTTSFEEGTPVNLTLKGTQTTQHR